MIEVIDRPNKKLKELVFEYKETVSDESIDNYASTIGKFPYVVINGVTVESTDINYLKLYNNAFLPEIEISFRDPTNKLHDSNYPLDQQIVSILISATSDLLMPIRMDFYITVFNSVKGKSDAESNLYLLRGILDVKKIIKNYSINGTSYEALKKISNILDLGFASNISDTNDSMNWLNTGVDFATDYIKDIVKHSYMSDNTFLWAYVDFYYNLNYVDIETQMKEDISNIQTVVNSETVTGEQTTIPLILSNHPDKSSTNLFIDKYNLLNESFNVNLKQGYNPLLIYYDTSNKKILNYHIDPTSTKGDKGNQIVMKGQPSDNNYLKEQEKNYYVGKIDTDNMHANYIYAEMLNEHNLNFLQKIRMSIILKNPNYQLYRFQKVRIEIYKLTELDPKIVIVTKSDLLNSANIDKYKLNERLSGEWLITGINFTFKRGNQRNMVQEVTVVKRELTATEGLVEGDNAEMNSNKTASTVNDIKNILMKK